MHSSLVVLTVARLVVHRKRRYPENTMAPSLARQAPRHSESKKARRARGATLPCPLSPSVRSKAGRGTARHRRAVRGRHR